MFSRKCRLQLLNHCLPQVTFFQVYGSVVMLLQNLRLEGVHLGIQAT